MESLLRFSPVMGLKHELEHGDVFRQAHHCPINWSEQHPLDEAILTAIQATHDIAVCTEEVAKDETKHAHLKDRCWK